ncbi:hypothetical protein MalM25_36250 [Planctomycetes bacterium MalM25]|nr:hypothetical protein MalM25_36250 [Planctomycetes bacterium MalM25]
MGLNRALAGLKVRAKDKEPVEGDAPAEPVPGTRFRLRGSLALPIGLHMHRVMRVNAVPRVTPIGGRDASCKMTPNRYRYPRQGPVIASVIPVVWRLTNSVDPSGLNVTPANSPCTWFWANV